MKTSKTSIIVFIFVLVVVAGLCLRFLNNHSVSYLNSGNKNNTGPAINSDQDLMSASQNLDATDVTQINSGLNQNDTDAKFFAPRIRYKNGSSTNWSGYALETNLANPQSNAVSDVKSSWTVPVVTCTSVNTYSSAWVGIDGYSDNTVEQIGTEQDCINGSPSYYAWFEMYPKPGFKVNLTVKAGDIINAEVQYLYGNKFQLTLTDVNTGKTFSTIQNARASRQSAEWVMEAPWSGGVLPLSNFGTIYFTGSQATLNGRTGTINDSAWQNDSITMVNSSGTPKATPSSLSTNGTSFSVQWNKSN